MRTVQQTRAVVVIASLGAAIPMLAGLGFMLVSTPAWAGVYCTSNDSCGTLGECVHEVDYPIMVCEMDTSGGPGNHTQCCYDKWVGTECWRPHNVTQVLQCTQCEPWGEPDPIPDTLNCCNLQCCFLPEGGTTYCNSGTGGCNSAGWTACP